MSTCRIALSLCLSALTLTATADVPRVLHYQGTLLNSDGQAIHCPDDGSCETNFVMTFRLYSSVAGGDILYEQTEPSVPIVDGIFTVVLGKTNPVPLDVVALDTLYLGVSVNNEGEMEPRLRISSSAYAFRAASAKKANDAETLGGQPPESFLTPEAAEKAPLTAP